MSHHELVCYIVSNYASHYLVPLSEKYDVKIWNAAMGEAFERLGLVRQGVDVNMVGSGQNSSTSFSARKGRPVTLYNTVHKRWRSASRSPSTIISPT